MVSVAMTESVPGFLRAHRLQIVGLLLALMFAGGLGFLAVHGSGGTAASPASTPSATPSPTPDPRIAQVKDVAVGFLNVMEESGKTGDSTMARQFTVKDSIAATEAAAKADISLQERKNFIVARTEIDASSWRTRITTTAVVDFDYLLIGHLATWPDLKPLEPDRRNGPYHAHLELVKQDGRWLIETFRQS
ncbi:MAG: hypothetical protein ACR2GX_07890 [Candidatus Dormibacteria bacterium]